MFKTIQQFGGLVVKTLNKSLNQLIIKLGDDSIDSLQSQRKIINSKAPRFIRSTNPVNPPNVKSK